VGAVLHVFSIDGVEKMTAVNLLKMTTVNLSRIRPDMQRILLLDGHPAAKSLSAELIDAYAAGAAEQGHELRRHDLSSMTFDADFGARGYGDQKPQEPDLARFLDDLDWSGHLVIALPLWWGGAPARLKGLFDRALLPGRAFDPRKPLWSGLPAPLMGGRSARILLTSDTPNWAFGLLYSWAFRNQMQRQVLGFVGIKPTRMTNFAIARQAGPEKIAAWLDTARGLGRRAR
jgi:putative NADPH-quinone reductase